MIDLELWRARIGLYHAASASRRSKKLKHSSQGVHMSTTTKWGTKEAVDGIPFALRSCIAAVSLVLVIQCVLTFFKKQNIRKALSSFVEASYRVLKTVLTSGVPLLLKVCVVVIPLLLLLAGDVERNPGPIEGITVVAEQVNLLAVLLSGLTDEWELFVAQLGVHPVIVSQIKHDNANKPEGSKLCLVAGLQHWVQSTEDPTYEKIVAVLQGRAVTDKTLTDDVEYFAKNMKGYSVTDDERGVLKQTSTLSAEPATSDAVIMVDSASPKPPDSVTAEHVSKLAAVLDEVAADWYLFMGQLGVPTHKRKQIEHDLGRNSQRCLEAGLDYWVKSTDDPTYEKIITVLRGRVVTNKPLADIVEDLAKGDGVTDDLLKQSSTLSVGMVTSGACKTYMPIGNETSHEVPFGCGCGSCPVFEALECPTPPPITFPIMGKESLSGSELEKLQAQSLGITKKFNTLVTTTIRYFQKRNVSPRDITPFLSGLDTYTPIFKGRKQPFFRHIYEELENAPSVKQMMAKIRPYFSFFDFYVLEHIIDNCCTDDDFLKVQLRNYKSEFSGYISRRIYELPSKISNHSSKDQVDVIVKLDSIFEECNGSRLELLQETLADIFCVSSKGVLRLCDIKLGCFELTFQTPSFVAEAIFPLSEAQERELVANHVLRLSCGDYHFPHQDCQSDDERPNPLDSDDEGSLAVLQVEHAEVVSKGDSPEPSVDDGDSALGTSLYTGDKSTTIAKSTTITGVQDIEDTVRELRQLKERDEADAKRKDKPLLHLLACVGDIDAMKNIIESENVNPASVDDYGMTPLHKATLAGHIDIVKYLIKELSCLPACPGNQGKTPLHIAAMHGRLDIVKYLVDEEGLDPLIEDENLSTPLHYSALNGYMAITKYLSKEIMKYHAVRMDDNMAAFGKGTLHASGQTDLKRNCYPIMKDRNGHTPLHYAAVGGHVRIIDFLVSHLECDPNAINKDGRNALQIAALDGQLNVVRCLIEKHKCKPMIADPDGMTPLHASASGGHLDVLKYLIINRNCNPMCVNKQGFTPLHSAAGTGHLDIVKYLTLELHCDPNVRGEGGHAPLHLAVLAAHAGHLQIVEFFVSNLEVDPNTANKDGETALHLSARDGKLNIVRCLIEKHKCRPLLEDQFGYTALHNSATGGHLRVLRYLIIEQNCNPMYANKHGFTPLHSAAGTGQLDIVKYLTLELHCDPNITDKVGYTPLHAAAKDGYEQIVQFLVHSIGCDVNARNKNGETALHLAVLNSKLNVVWCLLDNVKSACYKLKCDPISADINGVTTLHLAAQQCHMDVIKYLIVDLHCDPNITDSDGTTPLYYAARYGHTQVVYFLVVDLKCDLNIANGIGATALHTAALNGRLSTVKCLIENLKCKPLVSDKSGFTPLHLAAQEGQLHVVKYLIVERNYNPMCVNNSGSTPLHMSALEGQIDVVKYFTLDLHCDPNIRDENSHTPLHYAAQFGHANVVKLLVTVLKCDPNSSDKYGRATLHFATVTGHLNVVKYLIEDLKCTPLITNRIGNTALHIAAKNGFLDIVKYLVLTRKCDSKISNYNKKSPLHMAVIAGQLNIVKFYIEDLVIPADIRGKQYMALLNEAKYHRQNRIVKYFQQKLHPNHRNNTCLQM